MKLLDKFIKKLKTDRNTFFAYLLTLITAYIVVDRIIELLFMCFTGMSVSYWGPIQYTLAMACPVFAYAFAVPSKFAKSDEVKISFFYVYCIALYIVIISMVVQWINYVGWFALMSVPNYETIFANFSELIKPAFTAISVYIPLATFYNLIVWLYRVINDPIFPNSYKDSILDFTGIDLSAAPENSGPYSFEIDLCKDRTTGKPVKILENRRFESTLIVGPSGTGKSSMIIEPMIARDLEKKFFFREVAKEMGFTALKTGIATLDCPYSKEYLNKNFNLNMLTPVTGKEKVYKAYMKKMIYFESPDGKITYKNLGLISVTPDFEQTKRLIDVAKNLDIPVHVIDPCDPTSVGLNPFIIEGPALCALTISLVLRNMYFAANPTEEAVYRLDLSFQAIQNLVILLKVMFPKLNNGLMPTLEDLLKCFNNFDLVESMSREMEKDVELAKEYELQIQYFKKCFYRDSDGRKDMQKYIQLVSAQLDTLLRSAAVRDIICNRYNNIDLSKVIANNEVVLFSSRPTEIGGTAHKGFGKFFLWLVMIAVEGRPGNEKSRSPFFLYVDEFNNYYDACFNDIFTQFRKYKVGTIFAIPTLSSLGGPNSPVMQTLLANSPTKVTFGNCTPDEYAWWSTELGERREWVVTPGYDPGKSDDYGSDLGKPEWKWKTTFVTAKLQGLKFKGIVYKTKDAKGKNVVNYGSVDFLESKYKGPRKSKNYSFDKFNTGTVEEDKKPKKIKFDPSHLNWGNPDGQIDPIQMNVTDSTYLFDNSDAVIVDLKTKKKK
ncbi:MAG: hypothetical protein ACI4U9_04440 [Clostridia bacterium]